MRPQTGIKCKAIPINGMQNMELCDRQLSPVAGQLKGISRGSEAFQRHLNNFYHISVLCYPYQTIDPWTCKVMVPFILEQ